MPQLDLTLWFTAGLEASLGLWVTYALVLSHLAGLALGSHLNTP